MSNRLPDYDNPPLDEVAIGVQFEQVKDFHAAHLGLYWAEIRSKYPLTEDQPPLAHVLEQPGITPAQPQIQLFQAPPFPRCWFQNESKTRLIQVQQDRFLRNWRQIKGTEPYPRYENLIREFKEEWEFFSAFVRNLALGELKVNQCELTYVNNIEREEVGDFRDLWKVFSLLRPPQPHTATFLPPPEVLTWTTRYKLPDERGRLHVTMSPAFRGRDFKLILVLNLVARGAPGGGSPAEIFSWFDMAHEWIVRGFDELTDPTMHRIWKKHEG
jgi:uncharacterized protein (TIGR04255 family)